MICVSLTSATRTREGTVTSLLHKSPAVEVFIVMCRLSEVTSVWFQVLANGLDNKLREDLERLKKIRAHRGLRHFWG